jgi:predicted nucleic acid-binding protein
VLFFFLDASALAKRYAAELGSDVMNHLFVQVPPDRFSEFNVGVAEVVSLLVRKRNTGRLSAAAFSQALLDLGAEISVPTVVRKASADNALVTASIPLIIAHSVNATDAILLRYCLNEATLLRPSGDDLILATSDQRLVTAARAEGLVTFNPETQTQADLDTLLAP